MLPAAVVASDAAGAIFLPLLSHLLSLLTRPWCLYLFFVPASVRRRQLTPSSAQVFDAFGPEVAARTMVFFDGETLPL